MLTSTQVPWLRPTAVACQGLTLGRQSIATGDLGLAGIAVLQGPALVGEQGSGGPVNATVHCGGGGSELCGSPRP